MPSNYFLFESITQVNTMGRNMKPELRLSGSVVLSIGRMTARLVLIIATRQAIVYKWTVLLVCNLTIKFVYSLQLVPPPTPPRAYETSSSMFIKFLIRNRCFSRCVYNSRFSFSVFRSVCAGISFGNV